MKRILSLVLVLSLVVMMGGQAFGQERKELLIVGSSIATKYIYGDLKGDVGDGEEIRALVRNVPEAVTAVERYSSYHVGAEILAYTGGALLGVGLAGIAYPGITLWGMKWTGWVLVSLPPLAGGLWLETVASKHIKEAARIFNERAPGISLRFAPSRRGHKLGLVYRF